MCMGQKYRITWDFIGYYAWDNSTKEMNLIYLWCNNNSKITVSGLAFLYNTTFSQCTRTAASLARSPLTCE